PLQAAVQRPEVMIASRKGNPVGEAKTLWAASTATSAQPLLHALDLLGRALEAVAFAGLLHPHAGTGSFLEAVFDVLLHAARQLTLKLGGGGDLAAIEPHFDASH